MKKLLPLLLVVAAVAAAAWYFLSCAKAPTAPAAAALEAEQTLGVLGSGDLQDAWLRARTTLEGLPKANLGGVDLSLLQPQAVVSKLGFDPGTPEGWAVLGVDPAFGVAAAADVRLLRAYGSGPAGAPVFLLRVTDRAALLAFIEKQSGQKPEVGPAGEGGELVSIAGQKLLWGDRRGLAAIFPVTGDEAAARKAFAAFLAGSGPALSDLPAFQDALAGARGGLRAYGFLNAQAGLALAKSAGLASDVIIAAEHYAKLFPGAGFFSGPEAGGGLLLATPEAVHALEQIARPKKGPPHFSGFLPASGGVAARFSVNLAEVTAGISALLPPNAPAQVRMGLEMGKMLLATQAGFSWDEMTQAVSGHAAVVADAARLGEGGALGADGWYVLMGVQADDKFDALLAKAFAAAKEKLGVESAPTEVAGAKGFHVEVAGVGLDVVRKGDVAVFGPGAAVAAALKAPGATDAAAKMLDDDVVYGNYIDLAGLLALAKQKANEADPQALAVVQALVGDTKLGGAAFDLRIDAHGLRAESVAGAGGTGAALVVGVLAALAVPAFDKYIHKSKASEARADLEAIVRGAQNYYIETHVDQTGAQLPARFPAFERTVTAPEDWHAVVCAGGSAQAYQPSESAFQDPAFKQLGFQPTLPFRYQYTFSSSGSGTDAGFTARAVGDLDCDGVFSTYERQGHAGPNGDVVLDPPRIENELE